MSKLLIAMACSLAAASLALAQQAEAPTGEPEAAPEIPQTHGEQIAAGRVIVKRGTVLSARVREALNTARKDSDIIMVTCLNDKLTQIHANLRNATQRLENLEGAADAELARHEYLVLSVIGDKLITLDREAAQCVGEEVFDTGSTRVTTEIDVSMLPDEDNPGFPPEILPPALPTLPPPASGRR